MAKFDTKVQELRYGVLKEIAKRVYNNEPLTSMLNIPKTFIAGPKPTMRCCIYKERAIVEERVLLTLNAKTKDPSNVVKVIDIACDGCPVGGYTVTSSCRGCIAHRCSEACPKNAIIFRDNLTAKIDKSKCINCGMCAKSCPYSAIENRIRPCEKACKNKAISMNPVNEAALINDDLCIQCGNCVYMCPFGAIVDESYILDVINLLRGEDKVYAVVAPSIGGNFTDFTTGKVISAIKELGFAGVIEAALGADLVAINESKELVEKEELTSSCCPSFVAFVKKNYPTLKDKISSSLSPMATVAKALKTKIPDAKVVFIGPCIAKKQEIKKSSVSPYVDSVLTFEELQALIDAKGIDINSLKEGEYLYAGSSYGRAFAKCGGLTSAVNKSLEEEGITFDVNSVSASGIQEIKVALNDLKNKRSNANFIEGMMCDGGCIGGPCNLNHQMRNKIFLDKYVKGAISSIKENVEEEE